MSLKRRETGLEILFEEVDAAIRSESLLQASELCTRMLSMPGLNPLDASRVQERFLEISLKSGQYESASSLLEELMAFARRTDDRALVGRCHLNAGTLHMRRGGLTESEEHYRAAAYIFRWEAPRDRWLSRCYNNLGILLKGRGDWRGSLEFFSRALNAYEAIDEPEIMCAVLLNRSILQRKMGLLGEAWEGCLRGLRLSREANLRLAVCRYSLESTTICLLRNESERAEDHVSAALADAQALGYGRELTIGYELMGDLEFARDKPDKALGWYERALEIARDIAEQGDLVVEVLRRVASAKAIQGNAGSALSDICQAVEEARAVGDQWELGASLRVLGEIYIADGKVGLGIEGLKESMSVLGNLSPDNYELAMATFVFGKALAVRRGTGDISVARDSLIRARQIFGRLGWNIHVNEVDSRLGEIEMDHGLFADSEMCTSRCREEIAGKYGLDAAQYGLITSDGRIVSDLSRWGGTDVRVLIEGETGVGKELVARTLHALGRRREHRFLAVDCGALSETLADSELFGHVKGSFTGALRDRVGLIEEADGGTLLLDEVGELSEMLQTKLLRVLEERKVRRVGENKCRSVDIRVMSATTKDLGQAVEEGRFRRDLYYRLKGVLIRVPSLRERRGDIDLLLDHFLSTQSERYGKKIRVSVKAMRLLREHDWPGNVRELKSTVEALAVSNEDKAVIPAALVEELLDSSGSQVGQPKRLRATEREEIERALSACGGNKSKAARILGIARKSLYTKLGRD